MQNIRRNQGFTLIELMIVVAIIAILAAIALPAYQDYVIRSQVTRVMGESGQLRTALETCINEGRLTIGTAAGQCDPGAAGSNLMANGGNSSPTAAPPAGSGVPVVTDPLSPASTIVATFGNNANAALTTAGGLVTWSRDAASGTWSCRTTNVNPKWAPTQCPN